jgi:hypothetical protein
VVRKVQVYDIAGANAKVLKQIYRLMNCVQEFKESPLGQLVI